MISQCLAARMAYLFINQCLAARMAHLFISHSDFTYEITVHAADCIGSTAVRIGFSLYT